MPKDSLKISFFQYFYAFLYDHPEQFLSRYFVVFSVIFEIFQMKNLERGKNLSLYRGEIMPKDSLKISFFQNFYAFLYDHS